jgi:hypothetical protein
VPNAPFAIVFDPTPDEPDCNECRANQP